MICNKIQKKLNVAKLNNFKSIMVDYLEISNGELEQLEECGFNIVKHTTEDTTYYVISE